MTETKKILIVDDEERNLLVLESLLTPLGHQIELARNGREALALVEQSPPDLVLLDVMMPEIDGYAVCAKLKQDELTRLIPIIMVTALDDVEDRVRAFDSDADDFLTKPVNRHELQARVRSCLRIKELNDQLMGSGSVILSFARAIEAKDPYTNGHSERVAAFSYDLSRLAGFSETESGDLRLGGLLHDVGKIGVPDAVLCKPGRLSEDEFEIVKSHTVIGERICQPLQSFASILPLIRSHHERLDGSGYPDGLKGDELSPSVRIMGIVDSFDAMSSDRAYRKKMPMDKILGIFREEARAGKLDPELVELAIPRFDLWSEGLKTQTLERRLALSRFSLSLSQETSGSAPPRQAEIEEARV